MERAGASSSAAAVGGREVAAPVRWGRRLRADGREGVRSGGGVRWPASQLGVRSSGRRAKAVRIRIQLCSKADCSSLAH